MAIWRVDNASLPDVDFGPEYREAIRKWIHRKHFKRALERKLQNGFEVKSVLNAMIQSRHQKRPSITTYQFRQLQKSFLAHEKINGQDNSVLSNQNGIDYENFKRILIETKFEQFAHHEMFSVFDLDGNGTISYFEFLLVLMTFKEHTEGGDDKCKALFELFDEDGSEFISRDEFKDILSHLLVEALGNVEPHELDYVFDTIDIAHNNKISYTEFKAFYSTLSNMTDEVNRRRTESRENGIAANSNGEDKDKINGRREGGDKDDHTISDTTANRSSGREQTNPRKKQKALR